MNESALSRGLIHRSSSLTGQPRYQADPWLANLADEGPVAAWCFSGFARAKPRARKRRFPMERLGSATNSCGADRDSLVLRLLLGISRVLSSVRQPSLP